MLNNLLKSKTLFKLLFLFVIILVTFVYGNHFHNSFHFDDSHTIVNNLAIRDLGNTKRFFTDGTTFSSLPSNQSYRPVVTMLNALDYHFGGKQIPDPFAYHISIFASFLLLGILLYFFMLYLLHNMKASNHNKWVALFITSWFWLHTANAETVNYIISRSDSFSTTMLLMAFVMYCYAPAARKTYWYMIPVAIGFLAKEPAILFIPLLFMYKVYFEQDMSFIGAVRKPLSLMTPIKQIIVPVVIALAIVLFYKQMTPPSWTPGGHSTMQYIMTQPYVILHYFKNFFVPIHLVVDTDWKIIDSYSDPRVATGLLFMIVLVIVAILTSRKRNYRLVSFGILWFLIALAPTSLIPFAEVMNDHRTFFPYIGLFIASGCIISNLVESYSSKQRPVYQSVGIVALMLLVLGLNAKGVRDRNMIWHTEASLWEEAIDKAPENGRAWMNYGLSQMAIGNYPVAESCFKKTLALWPYYSYAYTNMAVLKSAMGHNDEAAGYYLKAIQLSPQSPEPYAFYADFLRKTGRTDEALQVLQKGLAISPSHSMMNDMLKEIKKGNVASNKASTPVYKSQTAEYFLNQSLTEYNQGKFEACIQSAYKALALKPDYDLAYNNICAAHNQLKQWKQAIAAGEKGLHLNPHNKLIQGNLQVSYKEGK